MYFKNNYRVIGISLLLIFNAIYTQDGNTSQPIKSSEHVTKKINKKTSDVTQNISQVQPSNTKTTQTNTVASQPSQQKQSQATTTKQARSNKQQSATQPKINNEDDNALYLIDTIEVALFADNEVIIITKSDVDRPPIGSAERTRDDIVFERLVFADAKRHKIMPDDDAVDKYLAMIQQNYNLKQEELEYIFTAAGYSFEEGREQLRIMQAVNSMIDFKVRGNLIVPRKDIEAYYRDYPEYNEARYLVTYIVIPFDGLATKKEQKKDLMQRIRNDLDIESIGWSEPFWIDENEIAADKKFIVELKQNEVSMPRQIATGFELYRMVEVMPKQLKTLDERYREIIDTLRRPKYEELLSIYRKTLFDTASILYFN